MNKHIGSSFDDFLKEEGIEVPVTVIVEAEHPSLMPEYMTAGAAGADLKVASKHGIDIRPGSIQLISTGLKLGIPDGYEGQIRIRSSLAKGGLVLANGVGTIDSDYHGELMVLVQNTSRMVIHLEPLDRIAQLIIKPVEQARFVQVTGIDTLAEKSERKGGFGSTGRRYEGQDGRF